MSALELAMLQGQMAAVIVRLEALVRRGRA